MCLSNLGEQMQLKYSKCGGTIDLYNLTNISWIKLLNVRLITPNTEFAFVITNDNLVMYQLLIVPRSDYSSSTTTVIHRFTNNQLHEGMPHPSKLNDLL